MADSVQLSEFRTRVRYKADIEVGASSSRFPDAEIDRYINEACKQVYNRLVAARGQDYYAKTDTVTCVAGTSLYNLAADFAWLVGVIAYDGSSEYEPLDPFDFVERAELQSYSGNAGHIADMRYRLTPTQIELLPPPSSASWRVHVHYMPTMTEMSNATDTFDGINGYEEWAILTAAIAVRTKDEEDPSALMAERAQVEQMIETLAAPRDAGRPARIVDTRRDHMPTQWTVAGLSDDWDW